MLEEKNLKRKEKDQHLEKKKEKNPSYEFSLIKHTKHSLITKQNKINFILTFLCITKQNKMLYMNKMCYMKKISMK